MVQLCRGAWEAWIRRGRVPWRDGYDKGTTRSSSGRHADALGIGLGNGSHCPCRHTLCVFAATKRMTLHMRSPAPAVV